MEEKETPMPEEPVGDQEDQEIPQEQDSADELAALENEKEESKENEENEEGKESEEKKESDPAEDTDVPPLKKSRFFEDRVSYAFLTSVLCIAVVFSVLFTYTFSNASNRRAYTNAIVQKQAEIDVLQTQLNKASGDFGLLAFIESWFEKYSYYADTMSEQEMLNAAIKAYVAASGDPYAAYYTVEEYLLLKAPTVNYAGIGIFTTQGEASYQDKTYMGYFVEFCYLDSPAHQAGIQRGDFVYQIEVDGEMKTIEELGGYDHAMLYIRGEENTTLKIAVLRDGVRLPEFELVRKHMEDSSVYAELDQNDPTKAVIWINSFHSATPKQFKQAVNQLLSQGVEHFVFDVRSNPGGEIRSIRGVLSYFLQKGDLIIQTIDRKGNLAESVLVEPVTYTGAYEDCSVLESEIGMFADLDFVVLCNEETASAAEVFTATLRDYGMAKIIGQTTYGKGVLQMSYDLSDLKSGLSGFLRMTTHAYVTKSGTTYHDIGIVPDDGYAVALSDQAKIYHVYLLYNMDQSIDNQLQAAFAAFDSSSNQS